MPSSLPTEKMPFEDIFARLPTQDLRILEREAPNSADGGDRGNAVFGDDSYQSANPTSAGDGSISGSQHAKEGRASASAREDFLERRAQALLEWMGSVPPDADEWQGLFGQTRIVPHGLFGPVGHSSLSTDMRTMVDEHFDAFRIVAEDRLKTVLTSLLQREPTVAEARRFVQRVAEDAENDRRIHRPNSSDPRGDIYMLWRGLAMVGEEQAEQQ